ncbi:MAG: HopJ type III effector protein [Methylococcaceae bacterium]|nr:HopJ type III effector protein [Methylococcaceae bacterium]
MSLTTFIQKAKNKETLQFDETITIITKNYDYEPTEFSNGLGIEKIINAAGTNEGSCKIFSFAKLNQFDQLQTLNLFGNFYHKDVLSDPDGTSHQNIRNFMRFGWEGISFSQQALTLKK